MDVRTHVRQYSIAIVIINHRKNHNTAAKGEGVRADISLIILTSLDVVASIILCYFNF